MNPASATGASVGYTVFDSPIGRCGLAWRGGSILSSTLPEADDADTVRRLLSWLQPSDRNHAQRFAPDDPALAPIARIAIEQMLALMAGQPSDLLALPLDMRDVPEFNRRVYQLSMTIPPGHTLTYGEVARQLDAPGAARAVGQALGHNRFAPIVPCHRILAANGRSGGFSAPGGVRTKLRLLALESLQPADDLFGWRV